MPSRRALLTTLGAATSVGTAGCLGRIRGVLTGYTPIDGSCDEPTGTWPTAGGDPGRTGRTDTAPPVPDAAAVDLLPGARDASDSKNFASSLPAVGDGIAYAPVTGGLVAFDLDEPMDGPMWSQGLEDGITAVPVLACGAIFAPGMNQLAALDHTSGERHWRADAGSHHRNNATVAALDDTIYVAGGGLAAVDIRTGTVRELEGVGETLALDGDSVYTTRSDSAIFAYDLDGEERWSLSGEFVGSASVLDGTVWVADHDGMVYSIDARSGELYWSRSFPSVDSDPGIAVTLAVTGNEVFVPAGTGTTSVALDAATGETSWTVDTGFVTGRPVVGDDWVAFGRTNEGVSLYDRKTGEERTTWTRTEYHLGTIGGLVPVENGFLVYQFSSNRLSLLR